jgi:AcrR family transcriptional regulator
MENQPEGITKTVQTGAKLSRRQARTLPFCLQYNSPREIARAANISTASVYRYLADDNFRQALEAARKEVVSGALEILKGSFSKAAQTLVSLLENPQVWVKLRVSERILETVMQLREVEEIQGRLEEVEKIIVEKRLYR